MKIFTKDNLLTQGEQESVLTYATRYCTYTVDKWIEIDNFDTQTFPLNKIINIARPYFDLSSMIGIECWAHFGKKSDPHIDRDEDLFRKTGVVSTPLCSIVYYVDIQNLKGGSLLIGNNSIEPLSNRLVMFPPGMLHEVEPFTGTRSVLSINPWSYKVQ